MDDNLLQKLKDWRRDTADKEGIDSFRVFHNATLETITLLKPKTKEELISIKGIKERKFNKYGESILALVNGNSENVLYDSENKESKDEPYTISKYIRFLNTEFRKYKARVQGEVSSLDIRDGYLFFFLKDKDDGSALYNGLVNLDTKF